MSGGTSSGRPDMVCGGRNVDRGENNKFKPPEEVSEQEIKNLFANFTEKEVTDFARSFTKKVE